MYSTVCLWYRREKLSRMYLAAMSTNWGNLIGMNWKNRAVWNADRAVRGARCDKKWETQGYGGGCDIEMLTCQLLKVKTSLPSSNSDMVKMMALDLQPSSWIFEARLRCTLDLLLTDFSWKFDLTLDKCALIFYLIFYPTEPDCVAEWVTNSQSPWIPREVSPFPSQCAGQGPWEEWQPCTRR